MKKYFLMLFTIALGCSVCGICTAESDDLMRDQMFVTAHRVDDDHLILEWLPMPEATRYCILVENDDGEPAFLNCFTPEDVNCTNDEDICARTIDASRANDPVRITACSDRECTPWSRVQVPGASLEVEETARQIPDPGCVIECARAYKECFMSCCKSYGCENNGMVNYLCLVRCSPDSVGCTARCLEVR